MAQNLKDLAGRLPSGPRGMGTALKLLLGAGAVAYGVRESVFTGEPPPPAPRARPLLGPPRPSPAPRQGPARPRPDPPHPPLSPQWKAGREPSSSTGSVACNRTPFSPRASTSGSGEQRGVTLTLRP